MHLFKEILVRIIECTSGFIRGPRLDQSPETVLPGLFTANKAYSSFCNRVQVLPI